VFPNLGEDLRRYGATTRARVRGIVQSPGAWATIGYRFARWVHTTPLPGPARLLAKATATVVQNLVVIATNVQIPAAADIGPGLFLPHTGYVVLSYDVKVGRHCTLTQGVTLGHRSGGGLDRTLAPRVGDRVYIGPGAILVGDVEVGDDAIIGPGAVVTKSVPPRAVVVGNPARVISHKGSFDLISYPGMESDSQRQTAFRRAPDVRNGDPV
jgi:serine O-acetyltransferase